MTDRNSTIQSTPKQVKKRVRKPKYDTASYIARAVEVHGNKFNYEKTVYKSYSGKVVITCPIHGDFNQQQGIIYLARIVTSAVGCCVGIVVATSKVIAI